MIDANGISKPPIPSERMGVAGTAVQPGLVRGRRRTRHDDGPARGRHGAYHGVLDSAASRNLFAKAEHHEQRVVDRERGNPISATTFVTYVTIVTPWATRNTAVTVAAVDAGGNSERDDHGSRQTEDQEQRDEATTTLSARPAAGRRRRSDRGHAAPRA